MSFISNTIITRDDKSQVRILVQSCTNSNLSFSLDATVFARESDQSNWRIIQKPALSNSPESKKMQCSVEEYKTHPSRPEYFRTVSFAELVKATMEVKEKILKAIPYAEFTGYSRPSKRNSDKLLASPAFH